MPSSGRGLAISAWLTGVYFVIEMGIGLWTGAVAVISDAFHTFRLLADARDEPRQRGRGRPSPANPRRKSLARYEGRGEIEVKFHVPDMNCGHCTAAIEKALKAVDPKAEVKSDLPSRTVTVRSGQDIGGMKAALEKAGYRATPE